MKVAVVASSPSLRRGLATLVRDSGAFELGAELSWDELAAVEAELVLAELETGESLRLPGEPFVLLLDFEVDPAQWAPGRGFLRRDCDDDTVFAGLLAVYQGLSVTDTVPSRPRGTDELTPRELELLELLAGGGQNKELAVHLGISDNTVKFHLSSIYSKLGVSSRTQAVTAGIRLGYLSL